MDAEGAELDFIHVTPAATLAGAAVKLRGLLDEQYILDGDEALCLSVRQVLELVEKLVGESDGAEFIAAEREIAEADRLAEAGSDDEDFGPIYDRYDAATDFIAATEPQSLVAIAVKLRWALRADGPLVGDEREWNSLDQSVIFLERVTAA